MSNLAYELDARRMYEYINGKAINMSPLPFEPHTTVTFNIALTFGSYLKGKRCRVYKEDKYLRLDKMDGVDFNKLAINKKASRLIPDVMVVCNPDIIKQDGIYGAPDLIVEVMSKSTARNDKGIKKDIYELIGVKEYWLVDTNAPSIDVYLLKDGKYELNHVYSLYTDEELQSMMEDEEYDEERKNIITEFKTSIFDDLIISLEDVFEKL